MYCPYCGCGESHVVDSRTAEGNSIRRRRECLSCGRRFTTYEVVEMEPVIVIKKDGSRQRFDRRKIFNGLLRACEKRPVSSEQLKSLAIAIEQELQSAANREITSERIGELVLARLQTVDEVAYIRFASVYRRFEDLSSFQTELIRLQENRKSNAGQ